MVLRYWYLLRSSWARLFELMYWPTITMVLWGFITLHLRENSSWVAQAAGVLLAAVMLWDVLFRGQLGYSVSFLEEMWSRNLGHLFVSPLRPQEMVLALMCISIVRTLIGMVPPVLLAIPLYEYNLFTLGLPLLAFFVNLLVMGWAIGAGVTAMLLRIGMGAESLAWLAIFLLAPISCIYYPVEVLPAWLQPLAWAFPMVYVFEGMRDVLFDQVFRWDLLAGAVALNAVYLTLGLLSFLWAFRSARRSGALLQMGE
jgi:ABC-2 type transport system permease protein